MTKTVKCDLSVELPEGTEIEEIAFLLCQDPDEESDSESPQLLKVSTKDAGAGAYGILETERWAFDEGELSLIDAFLSSMSSVQDTFHKAAMERRERGQPQGG